MKLDNMIADGIENTLYDPCRWDRKRHGSSLSDE